MLYGAINANVGQNQMDTPLIQLIFELDRMGVDALIFTEFGLVQYFSRKAPVMPVCMQYIDGVYNIETVRLLKKIGVTPDYFLCESIF